MDATSGTARCDELMRRGRFVATAHAISICTYGIYLTIAIYLRFVQYIIYTFTQLFLQFIQLFHNFLPCKLILHLKDETFGTVPGKETICLKFSFSFLQFI